MTTVEAIKPGVRVRIGSYAVSRNDVPEPMYWLKADREGTFIAENAVDYIAFDARESRSTSSDHRYCGNPSYDLSNIFQYLNSDEEMWFCKTHSVDEEPRLNNTAGYISQYGDHPGFLCGFKDYEIASMIGAVDLPHVKDVFGDSAFPLFRRKGVRPKATYDLISRKLRNDGFDTQSYIDFWTCDPSADGYTPRIFTIGRDGNTVARYPYESSGLRPVIRINPSAMIDADGDGVLVLAPFTVEDNSRICSSDDLLAYLGLAVI